MIYLDYNATTPVHPAVRQAIDQCLEVDFGNPSSAHAKGRIAASVVAQARKAVGAAIGVAPGDVIIFTGSATEANNLALLGAAGAMPATRCHIVISAIEHPAVVEPARHLQRLGWRLSIAPVTRDGLLDLSAMQALLNTGDVGLVSVMQANNELGTVQPVAAVAAMAHAAGALLHVDAAQAMGKLDVHVMTLGADLLTLAGHKMAAPKGIGALYIRQGVDLRPIQYGASQEGGLRPGTENVAYIAGLGVAAGLAAHNHAARQTMQHLRDRLQALLLAGIAGLTVNGALQARLPNTLHVSLPRGDARSVIALLADKVALSAGAACHADGQPSGVMQAIGAHPQQAHGALRLSLGPDTTEGDINEAASLVVSAIRHHWLELDATSFGAVNPKLKRWAM